MSTQKVSSKKIAEVINEEDVTEEIAVQETIEEITDQDKIEAVLVDDTLRQGGVVVDCLSLNVRLEPDMFSKPIATIAKGTTIIIYQETSTDEFYHIASNDNVGYCVKQFIKLL